MSSTLDDSLELAGLILKHGPENLDSDELLMAAGLLTHTAERMPKDDPMRPKLARAATLYLDYRSQIGSETPSSTTSETDTHPTS